jgi:hypothetical protein
MKELTMKLAAAAAEAAAPQGPPQGGAPEGAAPEGDPAAMGMEQPMDPMQEDNQRLTNILENLRLRKEIVEAHKELEKLDQKKQQPASPADDLMTREGLSQVAEMPKRRLASGPETSGRKDSTKTRSATAKAEPTTPDSPDKETLKAEPMPQGQ